jgi:hypothetical protein
VVFGLGSAFCHLCGSSPNCRLALRQHVPARAPWLRLKPVEGRTLDFRRGRDTTRDEPGVNLPCCRVKIANYSCNPREVAVVVPNARRAASTKTRTCPPSSSARQFEASQNPGRRVRLKPMSARSAGKRANATVQKGRSASCWKACVANTRLQSCNGCVSTVGF